MLKFCGVRAGHPGALSCAALYRLEIVWRRCTCLAPFVFQTEMELFAAKE